MDAACGIHGDHIGEFAFAKFSSCSRCEQRQKEEIMKKRKLAALFVSAVLCASLLSGCSSGSSDTAASASSEVETAQDSAAQAASTETSSVEVSASDASSESSDAASTAAGDSADTASSDSASEEGVPSADTSSVYTDVAPEDITVVDVDELNEPDNPQEATSSASADDQITNKNGGNIQVVFLGDSQLDNFRDDTGIAYLVAQYCDANVYNLAMGGTAASLLPGEKHGVDEWESRCFLGMVYAITGKVDPAFFSKYTAYNVFQSCDFSKTDIFVIEYGLNDYFNGAAVNNPDNVLDLETYGGALHVGIDNLKQAYPNATFILCGPNYAQFFKNDQYLGDGNILSNGKATLQEYAKTADQLASEFGISYLDAYWSLGINSYNADQYLMDGVHLSEEGRRKYAQMLSRIILRSQGYQVDPGTNLDEIDMNSLQRTTN